MQSKTIIYHYELMFPRTQKYSGCQHTIKKNSRIQETLSLLTDADRKHTENNSKMFFLGGGTLCQAQ